MANNWADTARQVALPLGGAAIAGGAGYLAAEPLLGLKKKRHKAAVAALGALAGAAAGGAISAIDASGAASGGAREQLLQEKGLSFPGWYATSPSIALDVAGGSGASVLAHKLGWGRFLDQVAKTPEQQHETMTGLRDNALAAKDVATQAPSDQTVKARKIALNKYLSEKKLETPKARFLRDSFPGFTSGGRGMVGRGLMRHTVPVALGILAANESARGLARLLTPNQ